MPKTLIVVPCFNEEKRLRPAAFVEAASPERHFLFVDDGSRDSTGKIIRDLEANYAPKLNALALPENRGKAEAVRQGVLWGLDRDYALIGFWDADLATPLDHIPLFESELERSEIRLVIGSRVRLLGRRINRNPARHYLGRVFASMASLVLELPVYDTQCGAKLFRADETLRRVFGSAFTARWIFDVEILARYRLELGEEALRQAVIELPLAEWQEVRGSKVKARDFLSAGLELWRIQRDLWRGPRR